MDKESKILEYLMETMSMFQIVQIFSFCHVDLYHLSKLSNAYGNRHIGNMFLNLKKINILLFDTMTDIVNNEHLVLGSLLKQNNHKTHQRGIIDIVHNIRYIINNEDNK